MVKKNALLFVLIVYFIFGSLFVFAESHYTDDYIYASQVPLSGGYLKELYPGYYKNENAVNSSMVYLEFGEFVTVSDKHPGILSITFDRARLYFDGEFTETIRQIPLTTEGNYSIYLTPNKDRVAVWTAVFPALPGKPKLVTNWRVEIPFKEIFALELDSEGNYTVTFSDESLKEKIVLEALEIDSSEEQSYAYVKIDEVDISFGNRKSARFKDLILQYEIDEEGNYENIIVDTSGVAQLPIPKNGESLIFYCVATEVLTTFTLESDIDIE